MLFLYCLRSNLLGIQWDPSIKATQDGGLSKVVACHDGWNKHHLWKNGAWKWTKFHNFSETFLSFPEGFHCTYISLHSTIIVNIFFLRKWSPMWCHHSFWIVPTHLCRIPFQLPKFSSNGYSLRALFLCMSLCPSLHIDICTISYV